MKLFRKIKGIVKKNKVVIYTAIFNDYDNLKDPLQKMKNCDFICFTDNKNLKSDFYKIIVKDRVFDDPTRDARMYKVLPHKFLGEYDYSLWVDGSFFIKIDEVDKLIDKFLGEFELATFKHPERDCIYDEADVCIKLGKDDESIIKKQIEKYRQENYPKHNGLIASGIILRNNLSQKVERLNEDWWVEIENNSKRDQLSFNYVAWKNDFKYGIISGEVWENEYFKIESHKK